MQSDDSLGVLILPNGDAVLRSEIKSVFLSPLNDSRVVVSLQGQQMGLSIQCDTLEEAQKVRDGIVSDWVGGATDDEEGPLHAFLRPRGLSIIIAADTGVTPAEPDQYWSVWVTDSSGNVSQGRTVTESDDDTSMHGLSALIESTVEEWKRQHDS